MNRQVDKENTMRVPLSAIAVLGTSLMLGACTQEAQDHKVQDHKVQDHKVQDHKVQDQKPQNQKAQDQNKLSNRWVCNQSPLLVKNVHLLGEIENTNILIVDGVIQWIGGASEIPPTTANSRTLDGDGATVLPGLIDSHTHFDALPAAKPLQNELDAQDDIFPITMRQTLASGVTTARAHLSALGDMTLMKELTINDCFPSPRIVVSGPGLLGGAPNVDASLMRGISGPQDARAKIEVLAQNGAEWLALHGISRFTQAELEEISRAASDANIRLMADTDSFENFAQALQWPIVSGEYINRSQESRYPDEIIAAIADNNREFFVVPPLGYYRRSYAYAQASEASLDPSVFHFMSDEISSHMQRSFDEAFKSDQYIEAIVSSFPTFEIKLKQLREAGGILVVGSDSGSLGQFHYDAIWKELAAWQSFGVTPHAIIAAATATPARMLNKADIGVIAPGSRGDLVLYKGDIEASEFARKNVSAVIKGGVIFVSQSQWVGPDEEEMQLEMQTFRDK